MIIHLLVLWKVVTALWVNVMTEHILSIDGTSYRWLSVSLTISMEGWFTQVGHERRVWQPSCSTVKLVKLLLKCFLSLQHSTADWSLFLALLLDWLWIVLAKNLYVLSFLLNDFTLGFILFIWLLNTSYFIFICV